MSIHRILAKFSDSHVAYKKSILIDRNGDESPEYKRDPSKSQIQWIEVPEKVVEKPAVSIRDPALGILTSRGYRWHYIHDPMLKVQLGETKQLKQSDEEFQGARKKAFNSLIQDLGSGILRRRNNKNAELTLDQQTQLGVLKKKVKKENSAYLAHHKEINIMIKLVFAALFENRPENPVHFVSDYVHHLNNNREELVIKEVDILFDRRVVQEEMTSEDEERLKIREMAQQIVESCINLAVMGQSYVDVMSIINSILKAVSPSEDDLSIELKISSAELAVSEILTSLLDSVAEQRMMSAELAVQEVLQILLSLAIPGVSLESPAYEDMKESVTRFVQGLLDQVTQSALDEASAREGRLTSSIETSRSILRKDQSLQEEEQLKKVKFQSILL